MLKIQIKYITLTLLIYILSFSLALPQNTHQAKKDSASIYKEYYEAKSQSDFETLKNLVDYVVTYEDPSNPTPGSLNVLSTFIFTIHEFNYPVSNKLVEKVINFLLKDGPAYNLENGLIKEPSKNYPMRYALLRAYYIKNPYSYVDADREKNYENLLAVNLFWSTDIDAIFELTHIIADFAIQNDDYITAESRILSALNILTGQLDPVLSMLSLSQLSYIYAHTGRLELARKTIEKVFDIADYFNINDSHIYYSTIVANLLPALIDNASFQVARNLLDRIPLPQDSINKIINGKKHLEIANFELLLAFYMTDVELSRRASNRYKASGWTTPSFDNIFLMTQNYITASKDEHCDQGFSFSHELNDQFSMNIANMALLIQEDYMTCAGKFDSLEENLKLLASSTHKNILLSETSLSRSMENSYSNRNFISRLLQILHRAQLHYGFIPNNILDPALEIFFKFKSSPAQRELEITSNALTSGSQADVKKVRLYFNKLREREIFLNNFLDIRTENAIQYIKNNFQPVENDKKIRVADESELYELFSTINKYKSKNYKTNIISLIQDNLLTNQGVIFSITEWNLTLMCFVSLNDRMCEITQLDTEKTTLIEKKLIAAIQNQNLSDSKKNISEYASIRFKTNFVKKLQNMETIFYVPSENDWNLPLQSIWLETGINTNLIISPTLNSLIIKLEQTTDAVSNYDYVGIGNPNYSISEAEINAIYEPIEGLTLRSMTYKNEIANFNQLPNTEYEIRESEVFFKPKTQLFLGGNANEYELLQSNWNKSRIIHFATHALISGELNGLDEPAIALSKPSIGSKFDGLLTATDIRGYSFPSSLIILSGCRTATDYGQSNMSGISGLSLSFLSKGARSLIVTQWKIPDKTSALIMSDITKNLSFNNDVNAITKTMNKYHLQNNDPYQWSAYLYISTPSRYNNNKIPKEKKNIIIPTQGSPSHGISVQRYLGKTHIAINSSVSNEDRTPLTEIFEFRNSQIKSKIRIKEYGGTFFGPSKNRFLFAGSIYGQQVIQFDENYDKVINQINLTPEVKRHDAKILGLSSPTWINNRIFFVYRKTDNKGLNEQILLIEFDNQFNRIAEHNLTEKIHLTEEEEATDSYMKKIKIIDNKDQLLILITRVKLLHQYNKTSGDIEIYSEPLTNIYSFNLEDKNFNFIKTLFSTIIHDISKKNKGHDFLTSIGKEKRLAHLDAEGNIKYIYEDIIDVEEAHFSKLADGSNIIYINKHWEYSDEYGYFNKKSDNPIQSLTFFETERLLSSPVIYETQIIDTDSDKKNYYLSKTESRRPEAINLIVNQEKNTFIIKIINLSYYEIEKL